MVHQQSQQMSPMSSVTGLSSTSSFATFHRGGGAWCTPPRLFVEDQVINQHINAECWDFGGGQDNASLKKMNIA